MFRSLILSSCRVIIMIAAFSFLAMVSGSEVESQLKRFEYSWQAMGVPVRIVLFAPDEAKAERASDAVYKRFTQLNAIMSDYDPQSEIVQVCRKSGESGQFVPISDDLRKVLTVSRSFTELSEGAFDITVGPIVKLWRRSRIFKKLPPADYLAEAKELVGNDRWQLDPRGVQVMKKNVRFDLGGIAKGYALDEALTVLHKEGITIALVDAGGDVRLGDPPPGKKGWRIGFASLDKDAKAAVHLELANVGIASSGDTFRYVEIDSVRYSHIIDPRTGNPMTIHRIVSIVAKDAMTADALASAVSVLGPQKGFKLLRTIPGTDALVFEWEGKGPQSENKTYHTPLFESILHAEKKGCNSGNGQPPGNSR